MRPLTRLPLEAMLDLASQTFAPIPAPRDPERISYGLHDTRMSGFAMLFFQYPPLLELPRNMQQRRHRCNLETRFGVPEGPSDTQMRDILDGVPVALLRPLLPVGCEKIRRAGWATDCPTPGSSGAAPGADDTLMLEGRDAFHATRLQCPRCLQRQDRSGQGHFRHPVVSGTLVKAGAHRVLPWDAEAVRNDDGHAKQDGESKAATRFMPRLRDAHPQLPLRMGGADLYGHEPFIVQLREPRLHHGLVCKPGSHPEVSREGEAPEALGAWVRGQWPEGPACRRRFYPYRLARGVALTGSGRVRGTCVAVRAHDRSGKQRYPKAWCTDLDVTAENVSEVVGIGRWRWQIENEPFNVQKNHGYELPHNSGHGQQTLSMVFYLLNLLAFLAHMILERGDRL